MFISPERNHISSTADDNTGFMSPERRRLRYGRSADGGTEIHQKYRLHTCDTCDDEHQHNLKSGNLHCTSPIAILSVKAN